MLGGRGGVGVGEGVEGEGQGYQPDLSHDAFDVACLFPPPRQTPVKTLPSRNFVCGKVNIDMKVIEMIIMKLKTGQILSP